MKRNSHIGSNSNIGIVGPDSVRLGSRRIENLPIAEAAGAKVQLPLIYEADKISKIESVKARYPKASVLYLESRIRECQENIEKVTNFRSKQQSLISDYTTQLAMCRYRESEIAKISENDPNRKDKINGLRKQFPPYDVDAMQAQIVQFNEGCERCDSVIKQEHESIAELSEVVGRCRQRDLEIKALGG